MQPEPYVVQTALSDFYVAYKLVVYVSADRPAARARVTSDLYAAIQDTFKSTACRSCRPTTSKTPKTEDRAGVGGLRHRRKKQVIVSTAMPYIR